MSQGGGRKGLQEREKDSLRSGKGGKHDLVPPNIWAQTPTCSSKAKKGEKKE